MDNPYPLLLYEVTDELSTVNDQGGHIDAGHILPEILDPSWNTGQAGRGGCARSGSLVISKRSSFVAHASLFSAIQDSMTCFTMLCGEWICSPTQISGCLFSSAHAQC